MLLPQTPKFQHKEKSIKSKAHTDIAGTRRKIIGENNFTIQNKKIEKQVRDPNLESLPPPREAPQTVHRQGYRKTQSLEKTHKPKIVSKASKANPLKFSKQSPKFTMVTK
jgi:hypothetical protein